MTFLAISAVLLLAVSAGEIAPAVVHAPDSPVRISRAKVLNVVADEPAVLLYAATNLTDDDLEVFTITAFIFDAQGTLKARQTAPGRRTLEKRSTKYSTMVLDGWPVTGTDRIVFGVNQALRDGSEKWWSAELEEAAKAAVNGQKHLLPYIPNRAAARAEAGRHQPIGERRDVLQHGCSIAAGQARCIVRSSPEKRGSLRTAS